ncbi:MAG TPA: alpha-amylase family glycosyl hydrolase, partial [Propionibacteriaceae bacterium]|nr:alpha-amylase family glycosyl hydrolase [Propionibacteriaceae bacterium]
VWEYTIPGTHAADNLWYRFIVKDGTDTVYYADDTTALDGGLGEASDDQLDQSWALMLSVPNFTAPSWAKDAIVYQIFPDRFRNGRSNDDPDTGDPRYNDPVLSMDWGMDPEGYCRNYAGATAASCPWRWDEPVEGTTSEVEQPRGRDYFGGDLKGVDQQLAYLKSIGINTIYLNPIFDAGSNHSYDTQDYRKIDPAFGTSKDFDNLVKHARQLGMRLVLDGVFNHMSSDSPFFDRYERYTTVGACESMTSPWRSWFTFTPQAGGPCAGPEGENTMTYTGWFGFDSIPVLTKTNAEVQQYFLTAPDAIAKLWLKAGAAGWRLDVSGDASFPAEYWTKFRTVTKQVKPDSLSISETWQKDSTLLRSLRGDRLDSTMNYRLRDAVLGLLAPQSFDSKGFADSGRKITASEFVNRLASVREDYPDAAYYSLMNLLDSHDTERLLWTLTDGANNASRDVPGADDKARLRMAALIQFTQAGMPTVYYGDEVGMTGADDPDDRRTYPWIDRGGQPDTALRTWYSGLAKARSEDAALTTGDFRVLLADDAAGTVAYGRKTPTTGAIVALNTSAVSRVLTIPVAGYLPDGVQLSFRYGAGLTSLASATVSGGMVEVTLPAMTGAYLSTGTKDLAGPAKSTLEVTAEGSNQVSLSWTSVPDAVAYNVYVSPVSGGGWVKANDTAITGTTFTVTGLTNAVTYYVVVRGVDAAGNEGANSNEVVAMPHMMIGWANLQWPPTLTHTISAINRTDNAYGQVWIDRATNAPGATVGLRAQLGYGPIETAPTSDAWQWVDAAFNGDAGNNDEFVASLLPEQVGSFDYLFRYSVTAGGDWLYADLSGPVSGVPGNPGRLTVEGSSDTTAPTTPTGFHVVSGSPGAIELAWDAVSGDASMYGYEIGRRPSGSGDFVVQGLVTNSGFVDTAVSEGASYDYVIRSVDLSFNRSPWTAPVTGAAALREVTLSFTVTVPATTDATGRVVHIAGFLDRLDGGLPQWNPGGVTLTRVDATHWMWTATGQEGTQIEYKYALGDWEHGEKDSGCGEISNRQLTLTYGSTGTQTVSDTVVNWRNVAPCGN